MSEWAVQFFLGLGVAAIFLIGPGAALVFWQFQKRRRRQRRRSPVGISLLRGPGHTVREQLDEMHLDVWTRLYLLSAVPLLVLALFLAQAHIRGLREMEHLAPVYAGGVLLFAGLTIRRLLRDGERLDRLRTGYDAEHAVGQELDQLMRQGAAVFHDFPAEGFNIDHVVIARAGVFAVETKGYTKPPKGSGKAAVRVVCDGQSLKFPTWTASEPLEQAERQAKWLANWADKALGTTGTTVTPVLALPGWFVERTGNGPVRVLSGKELPWMLQADRAVPLGEQDVQRLAHQVEQRCRTVAPSYRD